MKCVVARPFSVMDIAPDRDVTRIGIDPTCDATGIDQDSCAATATGKDFALANVIPISHVSGTATAMKSEQVGRW